MQTSSSGVLAKLLSMFAITHAMAEEKEQTLYVSRVSEKVVCYA